MVSCSALSSIRAKCHGMYGKHGEDCLVQELEEKRCLSFQRCAPQAMAYYGTTIGGEKAICASWAETFCFGDADRSNYITQSTIDPHVVEEHVEANTYVNGHADVKKHCRGIAMELAKCLRKYAWSMRDGNACWIFTYLTTWKQRIIVKECRSNYWCHLLRGMRTKEKLSSENLTNIIFKKGEKGGMPCVCGLDSWFDITYLITDHRSTIEMYKWHQDIESLEQFFWFVPLRETSHRQGTTLGCSSRWCI